MPEPLTIAFLGGSVGFTELLVVLAAALLLFGGKRLPEVARTLGKISENLRRAAQDFRDQLLEAGQDEEPARKPAPPPGAPHKKMPDDLAG
jgi:TatA/E family protein of Tat protein translocase